MRSAFLLCPHSFFRRHCQGLTHGEPSIHLHFGACIAKGLEVSRRTFAAGETQPNAVAAGTEAIIRAWGMFDMPATPTRSEATKTLDTCILAHADYFLKWPLATDPVQIATFGGEPCIEFSFALPIPGTIHPETGEPILYAGRFDLIGTFEGSHWGLDDKTTSYIGANWTDQWRMRGQFHGYAWGAREYGMTLTGFLVRGISPLTYNTKLEAANPIAMPDWKIERWLSQLRRDVDYMIDVWERYKWWGNDPDAFDRRDTACYSYNRACEFMPLCSSQYPERWESEYSVKFWNPLERGEEDG